MRRPAVDTETMLIITTHVTQETNDKQQMSPALEALAALPGQLGKVDTIIADCGYYSETNVKGL